ncbi:dicarboxylate/amino acid:cation symporter [Oceanobacillus sp. FSL K6-2867]|uniref:dicarboxylate/amino acid:cation symporter n=1 Tax=Oceanobacillus sp. FSL K6-2867 TaxID=2954748 RepID=UPI0030D8B21F
MKLSTKITISLVLGILFGVFLNIFFPAIIPNLEQYVLTPIGQVFLRGIQFVVVPLVFTSLIIGFSSLKNTEKVGRLTLKILTLYIVTNVIALAIGLATAQALKPGKTVDTINNAGTQEIPEGQHIIEWLVSIIPTNPFEAFATGNMLQVIFTAILIVIGIRFVGDHAAPFVSFIESFHKIIEKVTLIVLKISPIGVFALISSVIAAQGFGIVQKLIMYIIGLILAIGIMIVVYALILAALKISRFWKSFLPTFGISFGTASSNAALPVAMENAKTSYKMRADIASFAIPLGTALKRDGACILQSFNVLFVAQLFDVSLTASMIIAIIISALVVSFQHCRSSWSGYHYDVYRSHRCWFAA